MFFFYRKWIERHERLWSDTGFPILGSCGLIVPAVTLRLHKGENNEVRLFRILFFCAPLK